ncbi:MAG: methylase [Muribaculaceae bacterium]|nr:methylase [Muribaculaceae bacterium]
MINIYKEAARRFVKTWTGRGHERSESQSFWYQLLHDIFGIETPANFVTFELPVRLKNAKFVDAYIHSTRVLIEQKSSTEDLRKAKRQSDKEELTPYEQALRYSTGMKYSERPRWIVTCNFKSFLIYDMERPYAEPFEIKLENLAQEYYLLRFLVDDSEITLRREKEISIKAGALIGKLYDEFHKRYINPNAPETLRSLNILCVRLVFCLFAEDSGLFGDNHGAFYNYMNSFKPSQMRKALLALFEVLNTPLDKRDKYEEELNIFPYVNGGLFAAMDIEIPKFNSEIANLLLNECSAGFDWSGISPTIFGALFEDTMNPDTREIGCMHYTSVDNIHRVIDPLFLNELNDEFNTILKERVEKRRRQKLLDFQDKIASLTFLDPACGSGNFLTETYLSLRRLENQVIELLTEAGIRYLSNEFSPIKVSIENFYGIEINDFAVTVAKAALWIAEAQMMAETEHIVSRDLEFLPLKSYSHIECGNALTKNWNELIDKNILSFIIGNPPFKGKKSREDNQKRDLLKVIGDDSIRPGNMDFVSGWFYKAARYIQNTSIGVSFVTTINITRGEQVSLLWDALINKYKININYAYLPFVWNSESKKKAQVHCTIIGFSCKSSNKKIIYSEAEHPQLANNISPYLRDEETVLVFSRNHPLCDVPETGIGNKPIDNSYFLFKPDQKDEFVLHEPESEKYFMEWYGAEELIKGKKRHFLWLAKCSPAELKKMPMCRELIKKVCEFRAKSTDAGTRKLANFPTKFHVTNLPESNFIVIPEVSSEERKYIPMEYVNVESSKHKLFSNLVKLMPNATYYHFGVLQSIVHMVWTKGICGYKDFRPRYSTDIVFNNFPWPTPTDKQRQTIEKTAYGIIIARKNYPDCSLADLYDTATMPDDLRAAHLKNDAAVRAVYGFSENMTEDEMIACLLRMYNKLLNT